MASLDDLRKAQEKRNTRLNSLGEKGETLENLRRGRIEALINGSSTNDLTVRKNNELAAAKEGLNSLRNSLTARKDANNHVDKKGAFQENFQKRVQNYSTQIIKEVDEKIKSFSLELVVILDKSGSCRGREISTITGFRNLIEELKKQGYTNIKVTVELFDAFSTLIYDRVPIERARSFNYRAGGSTALYNTLGNRINYIKRKHDEEGAPTKTLVAIMTDGFDNFSKEFSENDVRLLVEERQMNGWEFIFLGAMNTKEEVNAYAGGLGIPLNHTQIYLSQAVSNNFKAIGQAIKDLREKGTIQPNWDKVIKDTLPPNLNIGSSNHSNASIESSEGYLRLERKK